MTTHQTDISRRQFLGAAAAGTVLSALKSDEAQPSESGTTHGDSSRNRRKVPMLHATDLFRPHIDPDDHWDLACVYALAYDNDVDLKAILVDYPIAERKNDPDVMAVSQMNHITGKAVPLLVGSPKPKRGGDATRGDAPPSDQMGTRAVLQILRESAQPVVINITGSCRDIAIAGKVAPGLFAKKCRAIYLNAGTGSPDPARAAELEYNARLDPAAYAAIFDIPCPVYWMPCFEEVGKAPEVDMWTVKPYGTYYRFRHDDVLPHLSQKMRNFFTFMYGGGRPDEREHPNQTQWFQYLVGLTDETELTRQNLLSRSMWCTGGFLHAVGKTVTPEGEIVPIGEVIDTPLYTFDPIAVQCDRTGVTQWKATTTPTNRYILHVRDVKRYQSAMTTALRSLLTGLP